MGVIQKDAFERLGLKQMLLEPEFLAALEADVHLVADLIALRSAIPEKARERSRYLGEQANILARQARTVAPAVVMPAIVARPTDAGYSAVSIVLGLVRISTLPSRTAGHQPVS